MQYCQISRKKIHFRIDTYAKVTVTFWKHKNLKRIVTFVSLMTQM